LGIDISVLSWTKRKARQEKNSEIRHVLKRGAKKKKNMCMTPWVFSVPPMIVFLLTLFSGRVEIDDKAILT
jgi:hypothetical protein